MHFQILLMMNLCKFLLQPGHLQYNLKSSHARDYTKLLLPVGMAIDA